MPLSNVPYGNCRDLLTYMDAFGCRMVVGEDGCPLDHEPVCQEGYNEVAVICDLDEDYLQTPGENGVSSSSVNIASSSCQDTCFGYCNGESCEPCVDHCEDRGQCINGARQDCDDYCATVGGCCHDNKCEGCSTCGTMGYLSWDECAGGAGGSYCEAVGTVAEDKNACYRSTACPTTCAYCANGECVPGSAVYSDCAQIGNYNWDACVAHAPNGYCEEKSPAPNGESCCEPRVCSPVDCPDGCANGICIAAARCEVGQYTDASACSVAATPQDYCSYTYIDDQMCWSRFLCDEYCGALGQCSHGECLPCDQYCAAATGICFGGKCIPALYTCNDMEYLTWNECVAAAGSAYYCTFATNAANGDSCYQLDANACLNHCINGCSSGECI